MTLPLDATSLRARFSDLGIAIEDLTIDDFKALHAQLSEKLKSSFLINGSYVMEPLNPTKPQFMTCKSNYFEKREAVSFNSDGFIGFAGWASSANVEPIFQAFDTWLVYLQNKPTRV